MHCLSHEFRSLAADAMVTSAASTAAGNGCAAQANGRVIYRNVTADIERTADIRARAGGRSSVLLRPPAD
jgi:hypothetical protein